MPACRVRNSVIWHHELSQCSCFLLIFFLQVFSVIPWRVFGHKKSRKGTSATALYWHWKYSWETNIGQDTTGFKRLILWNFARWKWLNTEPKWREERGLKCWGGGSWPDIQYHLFKKLHMFNLCQQLFHADMCSHSFQSSPRLRVYGQSRPSSALTV